MMRTSSGNMHMNSKDLSKIRNDLRSLSKNKDALDVIVFGSQVKGKPDPADIDIAVISKNEIPFSKDPYHISYLSPRDFFIKPPMLINILLREGYSLKHNKPFSETFNFSSRALFVYDLRNLTASKKVKIVNILRGKAGLVAEGHGEWLSRQVFIAPIEKDRLFEDLFLRHGIRYKKSYILIH